MGGYMNRGPSNYFLILCDVIIVLLIVIDDTISSTQIFFIKNFICMHLSDNCNLLIIISFISYSYVELLGFLFCLLCMILYLSCSC